ncbi:SusD/RagB family nutrient-binding outer membrane lipoprotein [soil metagenome]
MTFIKVTQTASVLALLLAAGACDEGLTDINRNPNAPTSVSPQYLFPQGVTSSVGTIRGAGFDLTFTGLWAQHYAKIQYVDEDRYEMRPGTTDAWWSTFYAGPLMDFERSIQLGQDRSGIVAPAMVMKSWTFANMTDIWGDLPYSDALQGDQAGATTTTGYDTQQEIYNGILSDLASANTMLGTPVGSYGASDPIYGGDAENWRKFANSLRARYGMRLSEVDAAKARTEVTAAFAAGVFTSNADMAMLVYPGDGSNDAPFFSNFRTRDDHRVSATLVDTLKALGDPRLPVYARLPADPEVTTYVGVPNGLTNAAALAYGLARTSKIGTYFSQPTTPAVLMSYAEVLFIHAEAVARGWIPGDAAALYRQGITASMQQYGISDAGIAAYLAQPRVAYNAATGQQQIALQKWIALFNQGAEAYAEVRRTGVPALRPGPAALTGNRLATRLEYPSSEQSTNRAGLEAAAGRQGDVSLTGRVWWNR